MPTPPALEKGRILGIGGIFFKSADPAKLSGWYAENLRLGETPGQPVMLPWRRHDEPDREQLTVWSLFPDSTDYFAPSSAPFMINYIVDDLDAFLARLEGRGVEIDPKREDYDYGRFAWIFDADGNKIELWEPTGG